MLTPGQRLGPYEITSSLGAGGMGEVYKARDTRLDRTVAIKVLGPSLAGDPVFRARFDREARAISALNHPHICTLHDVGHEADTAFLVMEYVDGQPLGGPTPPARAIGIGIQICEALDAAHRAGLVHRDLKPSNILLTRTGVKLLDFGLATRAASPASADVTMSGRLTGAHTVVGTPQYMAPEQIEGREADARSDIFALGCILYELVTGRKAFEGNSPSQVMAAILTRDPQPMRELQPLTPPSLEWIVRRSLAKDPDERWQSVRDLRAALQRSLHEDAGPDGPSQHRWSTRSFVPLVVAAILIGLTALAVREYLASRQPRGTQGVTSFVHADVAIADALAPEAQAPTVALSPDGKVLAYVTGKVPRTRIYVRRLDDRAATAKLIAEGGYGPFFSPDGRWIAFGDMEKLKLLKVSTAGDGTPIAVADAQAIRGGVWLPDDTIVFSASTSTGLTRVSAAGGSAMPVTKLNAARDDKTHRFPDLLPDGRHVIFTAGNRDITTYEDAAIVVQALDGGPDKLLIDHAMFGRYVAPGYILYARGSVLYAVPFDANRLEVTGSAIPVLPDVVTHPLYGYADVALSTNGLLVYAQGSVRVDNRRLVWVDRQGRRQPALSLITQYNAARPSPDGRRLLVEIGAANNSIWVADLTRDVTTRVTFHGDAYFGHWTPDGTRITYMISNTIREVIADGSGRDELLVDGGERPLLPCSWSPDGRTLAFEQFNQGRGSDIMLFDRQTRRTTSLLATRYAEASAQFSPDGRWLAYTSDESGRPEVYVRPFGRDGGRWQVSRDGATQFAWNPRGGDIVYRKDDAFFSVPIALGETPSIGAPVHLFDDTDKGTSALSAFGFALSPDGQRVLLHESVPEPSVQRLAILVNWWRELSNR